MLFFDGGPGGATTAASLAKHALDLCACRRAPVEIRACG